MADVRPFFRRHKVGVTFLASVLGSLLLMGTANGAVIAAPARVGRSALSLLQIVLTSSGRWIRGTWNSIGELRRVRLELEELRESVAEFRRLSRQFTELRSENAHLREQLTFSRGLRFDHIPAEIVGKDPGNLFATLTINRGSHHGVNRGMPVLAYHRGVEGLVGKVSEVGLVTSQVQPILDQASYVAVRLQRLRHEGLMNGESSDSLVVRYVKREAREELEYGDLMITSGMGGIYPKGIEVGRVREVRASGSESSIELLIEPLIDFARLEYVFVILPESSR